MYMYSMESPWCNEINNTYNMDENKILSYGPFDRCLSYIVGGKTELNRFDRLDSSAVPTSPHSFLLFKGCFMH
jgi:hypothetical protein